MERMTQHWTSRSTADFVHRITSDFVAQLQTKIEQEPIERQEIANRLGVTPGRVSQVLNNPGNLTVAKSVEYAHALGMKVALIAYEDDDPKNERGPVSAEVFTRSWKKVGSPKDLFSLDGIGVVQYFDARQGPEQSFRRPSRIISPAVPPVIVNEALMMMNIHGSIPPAPSDEIRQENSYVQ